MFELAATVGIVLVCFAALELGRLAVGRISKWLESEPPDEYSRSIED